MLKALFDIQARQQAELGLDPQHMDDHERMDRARRVVLGIHEEAVELQQETTSYKRHLLKHPEVNKANIADECADLFKYVITLAQMYDIDHEDLRAAFDRKTLVTSAKARYQRFKCGERDKVVCVDLDDVVCDLSHWQERLQGIGRAVGPGDDKLRVLEDFKDRFYRGGGFRDLGLIPGAKRALVKFHEAGIKIIIITARPAHQYKRLFADTLGWLSTHGIPHHKIIFNKDKVEAVHDNVMPAWPVAFIEDHPKNALGLAAAGVPVLLYNQPHNEAVQNGEHIHRVANWAEVEQRILNPDVEDDYITQREMAAAMRGQGQ